jgi:hypothetical protein
MLDLLQTFSDIPTKDLLDVVDQVPQVILAGVGEDIAQGVVHSITRLGFGAAAEIREAATNTLVPRRSPQYVPRCLTCGSDDVERITGSDKVGDGPARRDLLNRKAHEELSVQQLQASMVRSKDGPRLRPED